ncbi:MAG: VOC family protein [Firmicutes bacterium]|nr:VOC family protein [Bacillota bacterium]
MKLNPYLSFSGDCAKAVALYEKAFGVKADIEMQAGSTLVMHAEMKIGDSTVMMYDCAEPVILGNNIMLTITFDVSEKAASAKAFDILSDDGKVIMPFQKTEWSECFGLLTDKFGVCWNMCQS